MERKKKVYDKPLEGGELLLGVDEFLVLKLLKHRLVHPINKVRLQGGAKVLRLVIGKATVSKNGK